MSSRQIQLQDSTIHFFPSYLISFSLNYLFSYYGIKKFSTDNGNIRYHDVECRGLLTLK